MMDKVALAIERQIASPIPIGLTPGLLSNAINQQATKEDKPVGFPNEVHRRLAIADKASHRQSERRCTYVRLQADTSRPKGPAAPWSL